MNFERPRMRSGSTPSHVAGAAGAASGLPACFVLPRGRWTGRPCSILAALVTVSLWPQTACSSDTQSASIEAGGHILEVEIADTQELRSRGLMNRRHLDENAGMLFVFERETRPSFWMKNTSIPLSIAFIASDGTIRQIEDLQPHSLDTVESMRTVRFALEVNRGWFAARNLHPGDRVMIPEDILR